MAWLLLACTGGPAVGPAPVDTVDSGGVEQVGGDYGVVLLSEFMASSATWTHAGGKAEPWLELHNPGDERVHLEGWRLRSGEEEHELVDLGLGPEERAVLWADGEPSLGPDHLELDLAPEGGSLALLSPDGATVDALEYPQQATDVAAVRLEDGWYLSAAATPGEENPQVELAPPTGVSGLCRLEADYEHNLVEGDTVELQPICTDTAAEVRLVLAPEGATYDTALSWETGAADGGPHDLVFSATVSSDRVPEAATFRVWVADDPDLGVPVDPVTYTEEWGLPVFHLEVGASITQSYQDAELTYMGETWEHQVKIRGATSSGFPKPSYTLEFPGEEFLLDGWEKSRNHLVLLSTFDDNSYVRQKLVYDTWLAMAEHQGGDRLTPRTFFAVVYLDGAYQGLYVGLDKVDDEFADHAGLNRDGNLYKAVSHDANFSLESAYGGMKSDLAAGYEQKEGSSAFEDLRALVAFTGGSDAETMMADAGDWFEVEEFMDWWLLTYVSLSEDSAGKNSYLYNDPDQPTRFRYVPWDFNHSWGQNWYTARRDASTTTDYTDWNRVFWALHEVRYDELVERWKGFREGPLSLAWQLETVEGYQELIDPSAARDWAMWESAHKSHWWAPYRSDWTSYEEEKDYLRQWLEDREAHLVDLHGL